MKRDLTPGRPRKDDVQAAISFRHLAIGIHWIPRYFLPDAVSWCSKDHAAEWHRYTPYARGAQNKYEKTTCYVAITMQHFVLHVLHNVTHLPFCLYRKSIHVTQNFDCPSTDGISLASEPFSH